MSLGSRLGSMTLFEPEAQTPGFNVFEPRLARLRLRLRLRLQVQAVEPDEPVPKISQKPVIM